jgi:diguanylate cyclase (GGDEF)-like protein/putative nucleotidyltransferase with HDIG domain
MPDSSAPALEPPVLVGDDVLSALQAVADRVSDSLGFATVAINLYRPGWDDFQVVVVHGAEAARRALLHTASDAADWTPLLDPRFESGGAYFIPNGTFDWSSVSGTSYVPALARAVTPDAWDPEDALFVPLRARDGAILGVLSVDEPVSGLRPSREVLETLAAVAEQASLAAESAQQAAYLSRHRIALDHLLRISAQVTGPFETCDILAGVCDGVRDGLGFDHVVMWVDDGDGHWRAAAVAGRDRRDAPPALSATDLERVLAPENQRHGCVLLEPERARALVGAHVPLRDSERNGRGPHAWRDHWLLAPMYDRAGRLVGALWADDPLDHRRPSDENLQALRAFANHAMSALEAARALERERHLATHDPLTGLRNRRNLHEAIDAVVAGAGAAALLVCDIDSFKRINDVLGYETGDAVLCAVAGAIAGATPRDGLAARLGGEEFAVLLPGVDATAALTAAETLRALASRRAELVPWGLTVSVGVAVSGPDLPSAEALLRAGGRALVAAKRLGRDRVVLYREQVLESVLGSLEEHRETPEQLAAMLALAETLDLRDEGTARHSTTVGAYAEAIARELGWPAERVDRMRIAGMLHDVGKLGVPDAILHKAGPLSPAEWAEIRRHPELGARILQHAGLQDVADWVLRHHERLDGQGYPDGLRGNAVAPEARVLSVADAYEAMTAARPYRPEPLTPAAARAELQRGAGSQFCPEVVAAFLRVLDQRAAAWDALPATRAERRALPRGRDV